MTERKAGAVSIRDWGGSGAPALLAHGMAAHSHWWDRVVPRWEGALHAVALDFRGHGDSDWLSDGVYGAEAWIEDIETTRRALGWERFVLCGHSMGARVALGYAERHPERLRGVVAVDFLPEVRPGSGRFARLLRRSQPRYATEDDAVARFRLEPDGTALTPEEVRALGRQGVRATSDGGWSWKFDWRCLSARPAPVWPQLPRIRVPALLVRGELTTLVSREDFARMAAALPGARALEIAGAHHHVPLDRPAELAAAIAAFAGAAEKTA